MVGSARKASLGSADRSGVGKTLAGIASSLAIWLGVVAVFYPPILAIQLWDPLDNSLYWVGLAVGCAVAGLLFGVPIRGRRDGSWRLLGLLAPLWTIFFVVGANVWFDRSPAMPHASRYLGRTHPSKGPGAYRLASWRRPGTEEQIFGNDMTLATALWRALGAGDAGTPVVVTTHAGALGWEWIADIARAP